MSKCRKCEETNPLRLILSYKHRLKTGEVRNYFYCRSCDAVRKRKYILKNPVKHVTAIKNHMARNPLKVIARIQVNHALSRGELTRSACQCGKVKTQAHHEDYTKPLKVQWLCVSCHADLHKSKRLKIKV